MREIVAHYIHDADMIKDILHDGFLIALTSIGALKNDAKIEAWLTTIMRNLALQHLKSESNQASTPTKDIAAEETSDEPILTFDELTNLIDRLPEGYATVFRLAVLDGLTHKEIGALLGIAPHSSSSQLSHAKAALRRLIVKYRTGAGLLSIIGLGLILWYGIFRPKEDKISSRFNGDRTSKVSHSVSKRKKVIENSADSTTSNTPDIKNPGIIHRTIVPPMPDLVADVATPKENPLPIPNEKDSLPGDSIRVIPLNPDRDEYFAREVSPQLYNQETPGWSLALAYSGNLGERESNIFKIPDPNLPDAEGPDEEIEVTEKTRHYMPLVFGLSVNKTISNRWGVETGLRYSLLRSDFLSESKLSRTETFQRIHYLGIPLKLNYRVLEYNNLTVYIQGGGVLDIPIGGKQHVREFIPGGGIPAECNVNINAPLQWSIESGLGVQYRFTPSFSFYMEPSFRYYFNPGTEIRTIRQDKPSEFTLPFGIRLNW